MFEGSFRITLIELSAPLALKKTKFHLLAFLVLLHISKSTTERGSAGGRQMLWVVRRSAGH